MITGGRGNSRIFPSKNLLDWKEESEIMGINGELLRTECFDLFSLRVDGVKNKIKWVLILGGIYYVLGDFKKIRGKYVFNAEIVHIRLFHTASDYCGLKFKIFLDENVIEIFCADGLKVLSGFAFLTAICLLRYAL